MNLAMRVSAPDRNVPLASQVEALSSRIKGRVVGPTHPEYDRARAVSLGNFDQRPGLIVRVADAPDVADTVEFARRNGLELAVRSGGHSTCGFSGTEGGLVIDLRDLNTLDINHKELTVWAGSGLTSGEVTQALEQHQLIVGFGDSANVGIGGLTLGGGIGYLARKHGLTIDSLLAAEVVTARGDILIADETTHADLFWALRGGGGNFGVVTRFKFRLHPLPAFTGGPLVLPATPETLAGFVAAAEAAPGELTTILMVMPAPPLPFLPADVIGKTVMVGMMAFAGPADEAQEALAPFRSLAEPIADLVGPAPFSSMYLPEDPNERPAVSVRTRFMDGFGREQAARMLELLERCEAPMRMGQIRVLGKAASHIPNYATAYAHRDSSLMLTFLAMDATAEAAARNDRWASDCIDAFPQKTDAAYVNFLGDEDRLRAAYPTATLDRLRSIKRKYDPENLFRLNQNIPPA
ncbi:FAD-binding oxidoreductase [Devosia nitrariae]|uniref:FAD-linked oxidase n=1 Tax=Devosia nitrariae TaxID=2071872 RepID=A0ABQ5VZS6_9HYPH|nr:FAD-binding oxidoreductase [Devosia nitrariae]GLQ53081.1 FAD-linked oxidase [Devosia nitrariae]